MNTHANKLIAAGIVVVAASETFGQGFLVVPRELRMSGVYAVPFHRVNMQVEDQVCKVQVAQAFRNPTGRTLEVEYFFPLPEDAAIDNFVMMVDGKEMPGKLMARDEARRIYEDIVRRQKDPALMEYMGRGLFKTSVFPIPAGAQREINISFTRLCKRDGNVVEIRYPLGTEKYSVQPLDELRLNCHIKSTHPVKSVYSSTHDVNVTRPSEKQADVSLIQRNVIPRADFALLYTVSDDDVGLSVVSYRPDTSEAGYFLLLASPKVEHTEHEVMNKSVIFVLDKSGSMTGKKIEQACSSLNFVLKNLNPGDNFNIITYDAEINSFAPELQKADSESISRAHEFVQRISAGGSTNIDGALRTAMRMAQSPETPTYIIFLTDGLPTAGEKSEAAIVDNCTNANGVRARLMAFGVGDDVNARLLDKLVARNFGNSHYVRPNEDIEAPVSKLYSKLSAPVLSYLELDFPGLDTSRTYPRTLPDLFKGNQVVLVGRYHQPGNVTIKLSGKVSGDRKSFTEQVTLDDHKAPYARSFVEKLWAERRIGYLIDEIDRHGKNQELVNEIVALSKRYGILTPYTSFLADEDVRLADRALYHDATRSFDALDISVSGSAGTGQRASKQGRMYARRPGALGGGGPGGAGEGGAGGHGGPGGSGGAPARVGGGYAAGTYQLGETLEGEVYEVQSVLAIGQKTFFRKKGIWIDSLLTEEQKKDAVKLVQFSDEYFDLIRQLPATINQYFTLDGELLIRVNGKNYWIVPEEVVNSEK